jgi:hypothetical protein
VQKLLTPIERKKQGEVQKNSKYVDNQIMNVFAKALLILHLYNIFIIGVLLYMILQLQLTLYT